MLGFFDLTGHPFGDTPDPNFLFYSQTHAEALASLLHGITSDRGFFALIAAPGTGKTTLLFRLLQHYNRIARTAFVFQTQCTSREFLRYLWSDLGLPLHKEVDPVDMNNQFQELLIRETAAGRRCIVFIDEAQNLSGDVLEAVRLLSDFETTRAKLLQIVLAGQPSLETRLADPDLLQLRQRLSIVSRLSPLSAAEVDNYLSRRLHVAGGTDDLFTPGARKTIAELSGGIPRVINTLCFGAMSLAYSSETRCIDRRFIEDAASDLNILGMESRSDTGHFCLRHERQSQRRLFHPGRQHRMREGEFRGSDISSVPEPTRRNSAITFTPAPASAEPFEGRNGRRVSAQLFASAEWARPSEGATPVAPLDEPKPRTSEALQGIAHGTKLPLSSSQLSPVTLRRRRVLWLGFAALLLCVSLLLDFHGHTRATTMKPRPATYSAHEARTKPEVAAPVTTVLRTQVSVERDESHSHHSKKAAIAEITAAVPNGAVGEHAFATPKARMNTPEKVEDPEIEMSSAAVVPSNDEALFGFTTPLPTLRVPRFAEHPRTPPVLIQVFKPAYPLDAVKAGIQGIVVLEAVVDTAGCVSNLTVGSGNPLLARAAVDAVKMWRYRPYNINGTPVEFRTIITVAFRSR